MSLVRWFYLRCNGCGKVHGNGDATSRAARATARKNGWKRKPGSPSAGADYCPPCSGRSEFKEGLR